MKSQKLFVVFISLFLVLGIVSCRSTPISELSQDDGIARIRNEFNDKNWSDVIANVDEYKARYPYSKNNPEADLMQANAYYLSGKFPEAIAAYEDFARKNPIDKNVSFAYYRIANSYDSQASEEIDREQASAKKAISRYQYYVKTYPSGEYNAESNERIKILTRRLAEQELFVARFYWRKDLYSASLSRYLGILKNYSQYDDLKEEAKKRAAVCYEELADILEDDPESDKFYVFKGAKPEDLRKKAQEIKSAK
jgi:outer membrane protein assembly factor BamD